MKLTCPECDTQFLIKPEAIGENGRTVRCSQCSGTWFAAADPDILSLQDNIDEMQARKDYVSSGKDVASSVVNVPEIDEPPSNSEETSPVRQAAQGVSAHTMMRDQADRKKVRRRLFGVGMIWIVTLCILSLAALLAFLFRAQIVEKFPVTRQMYQGFGIEASASGLEIYGLEASFANNDGTQVLIVDGKVKNYDVKPRDVSLVQLNFKNANGKVLASWVVEVPKQKLAAGETINFTSQYPNPPIDAVSLAPSFVNEDISRSKPKQLTSQ